MTEFNSTQFILDYSECIQKKSDLPFFAKYEGKIPKELSLKEASIKLELESCIDKYFDLYSRTDIMGYILFRHKDGFELFWAERAGKYPRWEFNNLRKAASAKMLILLDKCGHNPKDSPDVNKYLKENSLKEPVRD